MNGFLFSFFLFLGVFNWPGKLISFFVFCFRQWLPFLTLYYSACRTPSVLHKQPETGLNIDAVMKRLPVLLPFSSEKHRTLHPSSFCHSSFIHNFLSINYALLFLPVLALCTLLARNRRCLGCESPVDFGKTRVSWLSQLRHYFPIKRACPPNMISFLLTSLWFLVNRIWQLGNSCLYSTKIAVDCLCDC